MKQINEKARYYKALGEPIRIRIIDYLLNKKECACICELSKLLKKDQSVIFRHIQQLKEVGIVSTKKDANFLLCYIKDKTNIKKYLED